MSPSGLRTSSKCMANNTPALMHTSHTYTHTLTCTNNSKNKEIQPY